MTEEDITYYRNQVNSAECRLQLQCTKWSDIGSVQEDTLPEKILNKINSTCGKGQLLINSKFKQFNDFLCDTEHGNIGRVVRLDDLRGFWETMAIQISQVEKCFEELDTLLENNFQEVESCNTELCDAKMKVKKKLIPPSTPEIKKHATASKNIRNFIAAQREKKRMSADLNSDIIHPSSQVETSCANGHT